MSKHGKVSFERRMFPRFQINLPITYEVESRPLQQGKAANASEKGLLLYLADVLEPGSLLRVRMHVTDPKAPVVLEVTGRVIWKDAAPDPDSGLVRTGVEFIDVPENTLAIIRGFQALLDQGS